MPDRHAQAHLDGLQGPSSRRRDPRGATDSFMTSELNDRRAVSRARRVAAGARGLGDMLSTHRLTDATECPDMRAAADRHRVAARRTERRVFARLTSASLAVLATFSDGVAGGRAAPTRRR